MSQNVQESALKWVVSVVITSCTIVFSLLAYVHTNFATKDEVAILSRTSEKGVDRMLIGLDKFSDEVRTDVRRLDGKIERLSERIAADESKRK